MANKKSVKEDRTARAQDWFPVADIRNNLVYRKDGNIVMVLRVAPLSLELLTSREKNIKIELFTECLNSEKKDLQILCIGRPVDLRGYLEWQEDMYRQTIDKKRKEILRKCINHAHRIAMSGQITERRFYVLITDKYTKRGEMELMERAESLRRKLNDAGLEAKICTESELLDLFTLFSFPEQQPFEDTYGYNMVGSTVYGG